MTAVGFDDSFRNRQAEPRSLGGCGCLIICLVEFVENVWQLPWRDTGTRILDRADDGPVLGGDRQGNLTATLGELEGVGNKVSQYFIDAVLIPICEWRQVAMVDCKGD